MEHDLHMTPVQRWNSGCILLQWASDRRYQIVASNPTSNVQLGM